MGKDVNKRKSISRSKFLTELVISAVIIGLGGYAAKTCYDRISDVGQSPYAAQQDVIDENIIVPTTEPVDPNKIIYENAELAPRDKFKGSLILVNEDWQYYAGGEDLVSINEKLEEDGVDCFIGYDNSAQVLSVVYENLRDMLVDFNAASGYDDILIEGAFRTNERQQELYDNDLELTGNTTSDRVALPGHSEHECGYAVDFGIVTEGVEYDGTGEYDWINQNCWKYGFILRYAEDKTDITKIKFEPWHYRYVGVPHAYYMSKNGICLEEYIDLLRDYTYEGEHLEFKDDNGTEYEIYYVPSDDGAETMHIPVPSSLKYDISGNNADGFIITVYPGVEADSSAQEQMDAAVGTAAADTTEAAEETSAEDETSGEEETDAEDGDADGEEEETSAEEE